VKRPQRGTSKGLQRIARPEGTRPNPISVCYDLSSKRLPWNNRNHLALFHDIKGKNLFLIHRYFVEEFHYFAFKSKAMGNKFGFSFSLKRALGITSAKQKFARQTGIPTTKSGLERKLGAMLLKLLFGKK
jgi:hypothetical protein